MTLSQWKSFGAATLACVLATGGLRAFAQFGGIGAADEPAAVKPAADDRQAALTRSVAKIEAELDESIRRNTELLKQLQAIRAELKTLRAGPLTAEDTKPDERPTTDLTVPAAKHSPQNSPLKYTTMGGPGGSALYLEGPKITRIAASSGNGRWVAQTLREPVNGVAMPRIGLGGITYSLGRYVYAFSPKREAWGVLELPKGTKEIEPRSNAVAPTFLIDGHMYTFDVNTAKWEDVDFRAILDSPGAEPGEHMRERLLRRGLGQAPTPSSVGSMLGPARP